MTTNILYLFCKILILSFNLYAFSIPLHSVHSIIIFLFIKKSGKKFLFSILISGSYSYFILSFVRASATSFSKRFLTFSPFFVLCLYPATFLNFECCT